MQSLKRRDFIALSAAGAVSLALPAGVGAAPAAPALSAGRGAVFVALVESLAAAGIPRVERGQAGRAKAELAQRYADSECGSQATIDAVLDAVTGDTAPSQFVGLGPSARLSFLRKRLLSAAPADRFLVHQALDLAALPFDRRPGDGSLVLALLEQRS